MFIAISYNTVMIQLVPRLWKAFTFATYIAATYIA